MHHAPAHTGDHSAPHDTQLITAYRLHSKSRHTSHAHSLLPPQPQQPGLFLPAPLTWRGPGASSGAPPRCPRCQSEHTACAACPARPARPACHSLRTAPHKGLAGCQRERIARAQRGAPESQRGRGAGAALAGLAPPAGPGRGEPRAAGRVAGNALGDIFARRRSGRISPTSERETTAAPALPHIARRRPSPQLARAGGGAGGDRSPHVTSRRHVPRGARQEPVKRTSSTHRSPITRPSSVRGF